MARVKLYLNKSNNQVIAVFSRKKFKVLKKNPKFLNVDKSDWEF